MARINEQRQQEHVRARAYQRTIAEHGASTVSQVDVDATFVAVAHAIERAEVAFMTQGDTRQPESQIQQDAMRKVEFEQLRCKYYVDLQDAAEDSRRRAIDENNARSSQRASWAQVGLAVAVTIATIVQTTVAILSYEREAIAQSTKPDLPESARKGRD